MAQKILDISYKCKCNEYFNTYTELAEHQKECDRQDVKGTVALEMVLCFSCASQLGKACVFKADGTSRFSLNLCCTCSEKNFMK